MFSDIQGPTSFGSQLSSKEYAEFYPLRKRASTMDALQEEKFRELLKKFSVQWCGKKIRVLSIGSGNGDFDRKIIEILSEQFIKKYVCVEPIHVNCEDLQRNLGEILNTDKYEVIEADFEKQEFSARFHLIHNVHVLHWMKEPVAALSKMKNLLKPNGYTVTVLQSERGIPRLYSSNQIGTLTAEKLLQMPSLLQCELDYVAAKLNVTSVKERKEDGDKILQFIFSKKLIGCEFDEAAARIISLAKEEDGEWIVEEPFAFIINEADF